MSNPEDYTVGWICGTSAEYTAGLVFLDEIHDPPQCLPPHDKNDYTLGKIKHHNVVITCCPFGENGTSSAATVAEGLVHSFPNVRIGLLVDQPPSLLRSAAHGLKVDYEINGHQLSHRVQEVLEKKPRLRKKYERPDPASDRLYHSHIIHPSQDSVTECASVCGSGPSHLVQRKPRPEETDSPTIHYGLIASANTLMANALTRDIFAAEKDVLCFEMEAAGLMNNFPCLVIRGVCDYADSHRNEDWQGYAAMVAAAYTKELLSRIVPRSLHEEKKVSEILYAVKNTQETTRNIQSSVKEIRQLEDDQESQRLLDWLSPARPYVSQHTDGTGSWFLGSSQFQQWSRERNQTLFCQGIPGAGKTTMTTIVIHHLYEKFRENLSVSIAYLFCNAGKQDDRQLENIFGNILRQIIQYQPSQLLRLKKLHNHHRLRQSRPSLNEIFDIIYHILNSNERNFILVDALDEFRHPPGEREAFLQKLFELQSRTGTNVFLTSRYSRDIESSFEDSLRLEIRASKTDLEKFLDEKLRTFPEWITGHASLQAEIKSTIIRVNDGMFLLAKLWIDLLINKTSLREIRQGLAELEILHKIPTSDRQLSLLGSAYKKTMQQIQDQAPEGRQLAMRALSWITCSRRDLKPSELQHALAIEGNECHLDEENVRNTLTIVRVCAGLLVIDEESDVVRLSHYTTREYLEQTWQHWFPHAHIQITEACITYLSYEEHADGSSLTYHRFASKLRSYPLYCYAAEFWAYHTQLASMEETGLVLSFLRDQNKVSACSQAILFQGCHEYEFMELQDFSQAKMTGIHFSACFGLTVALSLLLKSAFQINSKDFLGQTPLLSAAKQGHDQVVELLLKQEDIDVEARDIYGRTPLLWAAKYGYLQTVNLLLDHKPAFDVRDEHRYNSTFRPEEVVKKLLDKGAKFSDDGLGSTPLLLAASSGHERVVSTLLDRGADLNTRDLFGNSALFLAAQKGHEELVKFLLEKGIDIEAKNQYGRTALFAATLGGEGEVLEETTNQKTTISLRIPGYAKVVKVLLDFGANADTKDHNDLTALNYGIYHNNNKIVRLILARCFDTESKGRALLYAIEKGLRPDIALFLDEGAQLESKDFSGRTALLTAVAERREDIVRLLLDRGAEIEATDSSGRTALLIAVKEGLEDIVKLLLGRGAEIEVRDSSGRTALSYSVEGNCEGIAGLLLEQGADTEAKDCSERTALFYAFPDGRLGVGMRSHWADYSDASIYGDTTAPMYGMKKHHDDIILLLLHHKADIEAKDSFGRTVIFYAAVTSHKKTAMLLDQGASLKAKDNSGRTALLHALNYHYRYQGVTGGFAPRRLSARNSSVSGTSSSSLDEDSENEDEDEDENYVMFLLNRGAELEAKDAFDQTALIYAVKHDHVAGVGYLLKRGADVETQDSSGMTPLLHAVEMANEKMVKSLLSRGAGTETKDKSGISPLLSAAKSGNLRIANLLLAGGAEMEATDKQGWTPLHWATKQSHKELVKLLLESGATKHVLHGRLKGVLRKRPI
ncbi:hypothetical protein N7466_007321 [Penicillium verhagenii]|uniref:uncharacterized protein n=1 Tax=Penicillium verhagenii TaxID=1562060 RepID=UPI002544E155|nr:uncharacterized protein N7466_007321 [Penicillium verhagenii]KAJ5928365.1 hypothetical protein N7466_007321 [Penicillium verhagenii]